MLLIKIKETIISFYNAGVSEAKLLKKKTCGLSPATVYRHYNNLRKKEITERKLRSGWKYLKLNSGKMNLKGC